jgi:hypothetical protein
MIVKDQARAALGSKVAKNRLGIFDAQKPTGPIDFPARYEGKRGRLVSDCRINRGATTQDSHA